MRKIFMAVFFGVALLFSLCAPVFATERSVQDDQTFVYDWHGDRELRLEQLKQQGITIIRINLLHVRGNEPLDPVWGTTEGGGPWGLSSNADMLTYDAAVDTILAHGLKVQMTLVWYGQSNSQALKDWMVAAAAHFAGRVFRFSILNEPDLTLHDVDDCDPVDIQRMIVEGTLKAARVRVIVYKKLTHKQIRRFKGPRYLKVVRKTSTGRQRIAYKRSHKGKYRRQKIWKVVVAASTNSYMQDSISLAKGCKRIRQGLKYRQIVQEVAPAIRAVAPAGTQVMAGESSPCAGTLIFIDAATRGADRKGPLPVDGWFHHPYDGNEGGIYNGAAVRAAANGLPVGYNEFGYDVNWPDRVEALRRAWRQAAADNVFQMNQYGINDPVNESRWNTSLSGDVSLLGQIVI